MMERLVSTSISLLFLLINSYGISTSYKIDVEIIYVDMNVPIKFCIDRVRGGSIFSFFTIINSLEYPTLIMLFRKINLPRVISLDMICTNISIVVRDCYGKIFYSTKLGNGFLFANNWFHTETIKKPDYGRFYTVEIEIFGNYA